MAEIRDELVLDISSALRSLDQLSRAVDDALAQTQVSVDTAQAQRQLDSLEGENVDVRVNSTGIDTAEAQMSDLRREVDRTEDEFASLDREVDQTTTGILRLGSRGVSAFTSLRGPLLGVVAGFGAISAGRAVLSFFRESVDAASNLAESVNAVNVVFGTAANRILPAAEEAATRFGISTRELNEAATRIGASLLNAGFDAEEAADQFLILQGRASDTASVLNSDVNEVLTALQAALRGEFDPIERFTGGMNQAAVEARALELGLVGATGEMDNQARAAAVISLFLERTNRFAGDFANTSDSVANRQKTLTSALEDTRAKLGEDLLPAFVRFLDLVPGILDGLTRLTPQFVALADSMATAGERGITLLDIVLGLPRGFGALGDVVTGVGGALASTGELIRSALDPTDTTGIEENFNGIGASIEGMFDKLQNRAALESLIQDLERGVEPIDAFNDAIGAVARNNDLSVEEFERFAAVAGLTGDELADATRFMLENADAAEFTAEEIALLRRQLALITAPTVFSPEQFRIPTAEISAAAQFIARTVANVPAASRAFEELSGFLDDTGVSVVDFLAAGAPIPDFLVNTKTEAQLTGAVFRLTAEASRELAQDLEGQLATAIPKIAGLFEGAADAIEQSTDDINANIAEQVTQTAQFESNLVILVARGQVALANALREEGPAAAGAAADFVGNVEDAIAAEDLLTGDTATTKAQEAHDALAAALADQDLSPEGRLLLLSFATGLSDPAVLALIAEAARDAANIPRQIIEDTYDIRSPSKVMMALGANVSEGFFLGIEQGMRNPVIPTFDTPSLTGSVDGVSGGGGGDVNFDFTFNSPRGDIGADVERGVQIAGTIGTLLSGRP